MQRYSQGYEEYKRKLRLFMEGMTDRQLADRYSAEMLKLKTFRKFGRRSERFLGHADTALMNRCRRELMRRGLSLPVVNLSED